MKTTNQIKVKKDEVIHQKWSRLEEKEKGNDQSFTNYQRPTPLQFRPKNDYDKLENWRKNWTKIDLKRPTSSQIIEGKFTFSVLSEVVWKIEPIWTINWRKLAEKAAKMNEKSIELKPI